MIAKRDGADVSHEDLHDFMLGLVFAEVSDHTVIISSVSDVVVKLRCRIASLVIDLY